MVRSILLVCFAVLATTLGTHDALAQPKTEKRIALIIAQQTYNAELGALPSTAQDARLMARALESAGFKVRVVQNIGKQAILDETAAFTKQLAADRQNTVGFYYYSGHGAAARKRGANYLIPVGVKVSSSMDLAAQGVAIDGLLDSIEEAGARAAFVVLDACRNVPFTDVKSGERGMLPMARKTDMVLAFSTEPGNTADAESLFTKTLAARIGQPGLSDLEIFEQTKSIVGKATNRRQIPRIENGLLDRFYFAGLPAQKAAQPAPAAPASYDPNQVEVTFWETIKGSTDRADFEAYLAQYPKGKFVALAKNRLAAIKPVAVAVVPTAPAAMQDPKEAARRALVEAGYTVDNAGYIRAVARGDFQEQQYFKTLKIDGNLETLVEALAKHKPGQNELNALLIRIAQSNSDSYMAKVRAELINVYAKAAETKSLDAMFDLSCQTSLTDSTSKFLKAQIGSHCSDPGVWRTAAIDLATKVLTYLGSSDPSTMNTRMWFGLNAKHEARLSVVGRTREIDIDEIVRLQRGGFMTVAKPEFFTANSVISTYDVNGQTGIAVFDTKTGFHMALFSSPEPIDRKDACYIEMPKEYWNLEAQAAAMKPKCRAKLTLRASAEGGLQLVSMKDLKPR